MPASTITSKGQITLPKTIREKLQVSHGDRINFVVEDDGSVVVHPARSRLGQLRGMLRDPKRKPVSLEQMEAALAREHSRR
jgi:antitoxin PrlF